MILFPRELVTNTMIPFILMATTIWKTVQIISGRVVGKKLYHIASSTITAENFEFFVGSGFAIGYCTSPHNFENKNRVVISGLSTESFADLNGTQNIFNPQRIWRTNEFIDTPANTGLTTTISLNGPYDPLYVRENTIIGIGSSAANLEQMKVLNVDPLNSVMRVQRNQNGTVGTSYSTAPLHLIFAVLSVLMSELEFYH